MLVYFAPIFMVFYAYLIQLMNNRKAEFISILLFVIFVVFVAGLRWHSDADYKGYVDLYDETPDLANFSLNTISMLYGEIGYLFVTSIFKTLGAEFFVVTLLFSLFSVGIKSYFIFKFVRYASFAVGLYLCLSFVIVENIELRWSVATSFILLGYYALYRERYVLMCVFFFFSLWFHYFSAVFILFSLFNFIKDYRIFIIGFLLSCVLGFLLKNGMFVAGLSYESDIYAVERFVRYVSDPESNVGLFSYLKVAMYPLILFLYFYAAKEKLFKDKATLFLAKFSLVFLSFAVVSSVIPIFFFRTIAVADIFSIALIVKLIGNENSFGLRNSLLLLLGVGFSLWCFVDVTNNLDGDRITGYKSWLSFVF